MEQEIRWHYRFKNFSRAFILLQEAFDKGPDALNQLEREGVIQRFEYVFELAWKTLEDRLEYDGIVLAKTTPRYVIREAFHAKLIEDGDTWIDMLTDRNLMSHTYDFSKFETVIDNIHKHYLGLLSALYEQLGKGIWGNLNIPDLPFPIQATMRKIFATYPDLIEVILFGSRATGKSTQRSDIDLVSKGIADQHRLGRILLDLEDLPIPQICELQAYEQIHYPPLKRHIDHCGITIYKKTLYKNSLTNSC